MKVKIIAALVILDTMTSVPVEIPAHELPVLQAVHGEEQVQIKESTGEAVDIDEGTEPSRLINKYGQSAVEAAFGVNFRSAIAKAITEAAGDGETAGADFAAMTKADLMAYAAAKDIPGINAAMKKEEILAIVSAAEA